MNSPFFRRPLTEVLVKPGAPGCNLACDYCFYLEKARPFSLRSTCMSEAVLEAMIQQLMSQNVAQLSIGWQGGEPTLMGLPFYRKAVQLMERYGRGKRVANGFQTNGVLIDRQWAQFFRHYHFLVGLSLDDPNTFTTTIGASAAGAARVGKPLIPPAPPLCGETLRRRYHE